MNKKTEELLKANNKREELVNEENDEVLTDMICYLRASNVSEYDQELVRADLTEMILDAQERGEDIKKLFGENYKEICDNIIAELPPKTTKQKILEGINIDLMCIWILGIIFAIKQVIIGMVAEPRQFIFTLSTGEIVNGLLIIIASSEIVKYICRSSFDSDKNVSKKSIMSNKVLRFVVIWLAIVLVLLAFGGIAYVLNQTILTVPLYVAVIFIAVVFAAERIMDRLI